MTRRLIGATASLLALLAGLWLVLSPFALGFQPEDADWTDATLTDVWTGLGLALLGLAGVIVFALAIRGALIRGGHLAPRPARSTAPEQTLPADHAAGADRSREMDAMLAPLIAALTRDLETEDASRRTPHPEYGRSAASTSSSSSAASTEGASETAAVAAAR